ncbi:MAG: TolC family protein [Deltaproteobacteria bacterium]|nr:TolC family protein [Deltaproteobacteria bacterium]
MIASLQGCGELNGRPELHPSKWAPPSPDREWTAPAAIDAQLKLPVTRTAIKRHLTGAIRAGHEYNLPELIDIALMNNPESLREWSAARSAAAAFGAAQAPYYPAAGFSSDNGYQRTIIELPNAFGVLKQWQTDPLVELNWTLVDFGRRESASESSLNRLIAANLTFNRTIQEVVFNAESAFYALDAADGAVIAARQNLKLAETDFDAVRQRVDLGLATQPQLLLAKETVAQSQFDLANAQLMVHDAQAQMAVALGVPANPPVRIVGLEAQAPPQELNTSVEALIAEACSKRPDLAARVASLHASEADIRQARAQFFPLVGLSTSYGENLWNFTFLTPRTVQTGDPQYSALLTLRWEIFTGFRRLNDIRRAEDDRDSARAELRTAEINTIAQVWHAYFEVESSRSKYAFAQSLLTSSQESYNANLETYRQGLSTIVELLTAERDLANARYTLIQSKAQLLTAYAALAYAAGAVHVK